MRISLVLAGANVPDTPETRRRLAPQILRRLIDESLQMQEAKRLKLTDRGCRPRPRLRPYRTAEQHSAGPARRVPQRKGCRQTGPHLAQLEAEIAWAKLVGRRLRPQIQVTQEDIDDAMAQDRGFGRQARAPAGGNLPARRCSRARGRGPPTGAADHGAVEAGRPASAPSPRTSREARRRMPSGGDLGWVREGELGPDDRQGRRRDAARPCRRTGARRLAVSISYCFCASKRISEGLKHRRFRPICSSCSSPFPTTRQKPTGRSQSDGKGAHRVMAKAREKLRRYGNLGQAELGDADVRKPRKIEDGQPCRPPLRRRHPKCSRSANPSKLRSARTTASLS